jgi:hypothetical protein
MPYNDNSKNQIFSHFSLYQWLNSPHSTIGMWFFTRKADKITAKGAKTWINKK